MTSRHPLNLITAPFTDDQVASLNAYQADSRMHEFTCNKSTCPVRLLTADTQGWKCSGCFYTQRWAYDWMGNWEWKNMLDKIRGAFE